MRYFLIGFMGSGKSLIGKQLAEKLHLKYIDLDNFIKKSENRTISDIFNNSGENYFRELEEKYLKKMTKEDNLLVSTGGGTPTIHGLMDIMNNIGETIYLECCTETLFDRLNKDKEKRPMISTLSDESLRRYIENKLEERNFFYKKATYTICNDSGNCLNEIINILG
ncbi:AAA family ATPase [Flavobacteriales bacterium]|nr:AAA family ATPase [Flavobacteriales bacterium]